MDGDQRSTLEDGGMRMDALAALHGIASSLALRTRAKVAGGRGRRVVRQAQALETLAVALAEAYRDRDDRPDLERVVAAMARADACETAGINHDRLLDLPADFPFPRLALSPAQMALAAILPLRHGLLRELLVCDDPRRALQLRTLRDLERDLVAMALALDRSEITPLAVLQWLIPRFAQDAGVIQPADLHRLLTGKSADITSRLTAATILTGRPHAQS
jgi:hypothetical protein